MTNYINNKNKSTTNWYVITGGPCSGKTTTVNMLASMGYKTTIEHARHYLDTQYRNGKKMEDIRKDHEQFQAQVLEMQIEQEANLDPDEVIFLDRAIPDALAYYRFLNLDPGKKLLTVIKKINYKKIFILDYLPLVQDYARNEDAAAQKRIHEILIDVYKALPFPVIRVPVMPVEQRINLILVNL